MRLRVRWILLVVVLGAIVARGSWRRVWEGMVEQLTSSGADAPFTISHTYLLEREKWLEFPLPPTTHLAWVLTNANFHPDRPSLASTAAARPGAVYAIDYQIIDSRDNVLEAARYHFRTNPPDATIPVSRRAFYPDERLLPAAGQSMRLRLTRPVGQACRLRLRQADQDADVVDVAVRVYFQEEIPDYKLTHAWQRTSRQKQAHLCRASVYDADLLTDYEKRNLVKRRWRPLASQGVEGRDYRRRLLYAPSGDFPDQEGPFELPAGLLIDGFSQGVVPLPAGRGIVRLEITRDPDAAPEDVSIRWHGHRNEEVKVWRKSLSAPRQQWEFPSGDGMLVIAAERELVVNAFWRNPESADSDFVDITPQLSVIRAYMVDREHPVEYLIEHIGQQSTPLKIAFRALIPLIHPEASAEIAPGRAGPSPVVTWSFLAGEGEVVTRGNLEIQPVVSCYDRISSALTPMHVTDPTEYFFSIPPGVRRLRLESASDDLLVSVFSRPPDIAHVTFVPEDYSAWERKEEGHRNWFVLRPVEHMARINAFQTATVLVQPRPTEVDPQLVAGCAQWQSFQPRGSWKARYLLVPRERTRDIRWEALGSAYYPMAMGTEQDVTLQTIPGHRTVTPRLVCQSETDPSLPLRLYVNGQLHQQITLFAGLTDVAVKPLRADAGQNTRVRLETAGNVRAFMSHITIPSAIVFLKRMAMRFEGKTLQFDYDKNSQREEILALTLFHASSGHRARLRVKIACPVNHHAGPRPDWTPCDRIYEVAPVQSVPAVLFAAGGGSVYEQEPCFVRLGSDLPPGRYTIEVSREDDREGYVLLSKTTPGLDQRRSLATEAEPPMQNRTESIGAGNGS